MRLLLCFLLMLSATGFAQNAFQNRSRETVISAQDAAELKRLDAILDRQNRKYIADNRDPDISEFTRAIRLSKDRKQINATEEQMDAIKAKYHVK